MKKFEAPELKLKKFERNTVITLSSGIGRDDNELPLIPPIFSNRTSGDSVSVQ